MPGTEDLPGKAGVWPHIHNFLRLSQRFGEHFQMPLVPARSGPERLSKVAAEIVARDNEISLFWVPAHSRLAGNEVADDLAKEAAEGAPHCELEEVPGAVRWQTASRTSPAGALRGGPERRPGGSLPMCAQSEDITLQAAQASAVRHYGRFGSPWLSATTSRFRVMP